MTVLPLLLQFGCLLFPFLVWLLCLGLPVLCQIKVMRVGILSCYLSSGKSCQFSTIEYNVSCGFVIYGPYVEACSLYTYYVESFIINECRILSNSLPASMEVIWFLSFANVAYHIDWLASIKSFFHPSNKSHLLFYFLNLSPKMHY